MSDEDEICDSGWTVREEKWIRLSGLEVVKKPESIELQKEFEIKMADSLRKKLKADTRRRVKENEGYAKETDDKSQFSSIERELIKPEDPS